MTLKKLLCILLSLCMLLSLCACADEEDDKAYEQSSSYTSTEKTPVSSGSSSDAQSTGYAFDGSDVLESESQLDDFMAQFALTGQTEVSFTLAYTNEPDIDVLSERYAFPVMELEYEEADEGAYVTMQVEHFAGNRVLAAYFLNDTSMLNADEQAVYDWAISTVEENITDDMSVAEVEETLQNIIIQQVTYFTTDLTQESELQRFQTAIGAVLDGKANCMGYSDTFVMLATLSGLEVGMQNGFCDGGGHVWNIICLDGEWYAIDVTNNDPDYGSGDVGDNSFFNVGSDYLLSEGYTWEDYSVIHKMQASSLN